jgi:hypothetical protein
LGRGQIARQLLNLRLQLLDALGRGVACRLRVVAQRMCAFPFRRQLGLELRDVSLQTRNFDALVCRVLLDLAQRLLRRVQLV